jgi:hypothetical protein
MLLLQIVSALLFLLNKFYVYKKKTIGWIFGIFGTIVIAIYFYLQMIWQHRGNLWIMIVYDIALFFLMVYGYLVLSSIKNVQLNIFLKRWNLLFKIIVVLITFITCLILLFQAINEQLIFLQFFSTLGGLIGTLLLTFNKKSTNKIGWAVYFLTRLIITDLMLKTGSPFIAICQIFSAIVAIFGLKNEFKK